jgi:hypothetical protein
MQLEDNRLYRRSTEEIFIAMRDEIIPSMSMNYSVGYGWARMPGGLLKFKVIEDRFSARTLRMRLSFRIYYAIPTKWGPDVNIFFLDAGPGMCMVEMVAPSVALSDSFLYNLLNDIGAKMPGYSKFLKSQLVPKVYLDGVRVIDEESYRAESYSEEVNARVFRYGFQKLHANLGERFA